MVCINRFEMPSLTDKNVESLPNLTTSAPHLRMPVLSAVDLAYLNINKVAIFRSCWVFPKHHYEERFNEIVCMLSIGLFSANIIMIAAIFRQHRLPQTTSADYTRKLTRFKHVSL